MVRKKNGHNLYLQFLASYIIVMLIPVVVLYGLYTRQVTRTVTEEIFSSVQLDQQYAVSLIDSKVVNLGNIAKQFQLTRGFRSYQETQSFYSSPSGELYGEIIEDLFYLTQPAPFAENLFVYFHKQGCAFSSRGLHQIDTLITADYQYDKPAAEQYLSLLRSTRTPTVLPAHTGAIHKSSADYLTFIYPLYETFGDPTATAVFSVDTKHIFDLLSARMQQYNTSTYIYNQDRELLYCSSPVDGLDPLQPQSVQSGYWSIVANSSESGWQYITLLPKNQPVLQEIFRRGQSFMIYSALTLLLSSVVVWYMMRVNYSPIKRLKEKASGLATGVSPTGELEAISSALDYLQEQNTLLNTAVIDSQTLIANNQLRKLLSGAYSSIEQFNADSSSSLQYSGRYFFVAVIFFHHERDYTEALAQTIISSLNQQMQSNYIYHLEPDILITINCIDEKSNHLLTDTFCFMLRMLSQNFHISATVGVGSVVESTTHIGRSYMEAQSAVDYRFVKGKGTVILYDDIFCSNQAVSDYPYQQFERLGNALKALDDNGVDKYISALLSYITASNFPVSIARGICFDILRMIDENERQRNIASHLLDIDVLQRLATVDTAHDAVHMIQELQTELVIKRGLRGNNTQQSLAHIKHLVDTRCYDCDFSVQSLAAEISMLPSNLSTFFKVQTGHNLLNYIINLRMNKAKQLLLDTNLTLKDIGQMVGYYNISSFIRRFRQHQGVTPGMFRDTAEKTTKE